MEQMELSNRPGHWSPRANTEVNVHWACAPEPKYTHRNSGKATYWHNSVSGAKRWPCDYACACLARRWRVSRAARPK